MHCNDKTRCDRIVPPTSIFYMYYHALTELSFPCVACYRKKNILTATVAFRLEHPKWDQSLRFFPQVRRRAFMTLSTEEESSPSSPPKPDTWYLRETSISSNVHYVSQNIVSRRNINTFLLDRQVTLDVISILRTNIHRSVRL